MCSNQLLLCKKLKFFLLLESFPQLFFRLLKRKKISLTIVDCVNRTSC